MDDLAFAGVARQAELLRRGEVTPRALVETCLRRIERLDPQLNAFRIVYGERALAEAEEAGARLHAGVERPLLGVPMAIKDNTDVAGDVTTHGTSAYGDPADRDAEVVRRVRRAGAIVIGKTNVPPLCALTCTESASFGITRNPWNPDRTPGGSSGGSAAAVAAGMVPAALGSDGGGSIRMPSAFCGLFGLKAQRGRVSLSPLPEHWHGMSSVGWIARSVRDSALLYDATLGDVEGDRHRPPRPARSFVEALAAPGRALRVAWSVKVPPGPVSVKVDPRVARAVRETAELLASLGHEVVERDPDHPPAGYPAAMARMMCGVADDAQTLPHREKLDLRFRRLVAVASRIPDQALERALAAERGIAEQVNRLFDDVDVLLTPVAPVPAFETGRWEGRGWVWTLNGNAMMIPFTVPWNQTGQPAASVPAGFTDDGLPLGVQVIARPEDEATIFAVAAQLEEQRPWADRRPPVS
jgi:amidase